MFLVRSTASRAPFQAKVQTQEIHICTGVFAGANNTLTQIYVSAHRWY